MKIEKLNIKLTYLEPILGSASGNPELHKEYIASKAPTPEAAEQEVEAINPEQIFEKAVTVFPKDNHGPFCWDYQIRGFFKESLALLIDIGDVSGLSKWSYKRAVDSLLFVATRKNYYLDSKGKPAKVDEKLFSRPLRASTMQGERIALASSEMLPAGTVLPFEIRLIPANKKGFTLDMKMVKAALDYGAFKGISQWRGGGFGRFEWKEVK